MVACQLLPQEGCLASGGAKILMPILLSAEYPMLCQAMPVRATCYLRYAIVKPSPLPYPSPAASKERHRPTCDRACSWQILAVVIGDSMMFTPPATAAFVSPLLTPFMIQGLTIASVLSILKPAVLTCFVLLCNTVDRTLAGCMASARLRWLIAEMTKACCFKLITLMEKGSCLCSKVEGNEGG